jgi:putative FmdB family regulatory protein
VRGHFTGRRQGSQTGADAAARRNLTDSGFLASFASACYHLAFPLILSVEGAFSVPLYEYECSKCHHRFEKIEKVSAAEVQKCPKCGSKAQRQISRSAIQFKGSGWYVTDYGAQKPAEKSQDSKPGAGDSDSSGSAKTGESAGESGGGKAGSERGKPGEGKSGGGKPSSEKSSPEKSGGEKSNQEKAGSGGKKGKRE